MVILVIATVAAFAAAVHYGLAQSRPVTNSNMLTLASLPFIIALMGWMPAPMEMSVWQSLWVQAKARDIKRAITLREAMLDFNMGYWLTAALAVMFLTLGAVIMYGSGTTFADGSAAFAGQVVALYTSVMGEWSLPVIMMAAFVTMFSTTFTLVDGYPRSLSEGLKVALPHWQRAERKVRPYIMGVALLLAYGVIAQHANAMKALVDLVTTIAFLAAPIFAWMNYRVLTTSLTPVSGQPSQGLRMWCWLGFLYLTGFALLYLALKLNFV
jgi:Mn2+/Fe2+ NRAMP family transporter